MMRIVCIDHYLENTLTFEMKPFQTETDIYFISSPVLITNGKKVHIQM